jgi:hypothetical protein
MEGSCSTGQSPQWAVVLVEEGGGGGGGSKHVTGCNVASYLLKVITNVVLMVYKFHSLILVFNLTGCRLNVFDRYQCGG